MIDEKTFYRLSAQVQGLELVLKSMIALQFAMSVRDEAGFAKAAEQAQALSASLRAYIDKALSDAPAPLVDSGVAQITLDEMRSVVARCLDGAADQLGEVAGLVLRATEPASPAKN